MDICKINIDSTVADFWPIVYTNGPGLTKIGGKLRDKIMAEAFRIKKLTECDWANLFDVSFNRKQKDGSWVMCSRKTRPITDAAKTDAAVIVPVIDTAEGKRLVVTKEFRVPIWDYEYGFPAGLIDENESIEQTAVRELREETGLEVATINHISKPIYSSAGLTDESCRMVMVDASGTISNEWQEEGEDIEVLLLDVDGIRELLGSGEKISAKAWGLFYHYAETGSIR